MLTRKAFTIADCRLPTACSQYCIRQYSDRRDRDADPVALLERERRGRDDPGAGHQEAAVWEAVVPEEPAGKLVRSAPKLGERRRAVEDHLPAADDLKVDLRGGRQRRIRQQNAGTEGAALVVDF